MWPKSTLFYVHQEQVFVLIAQWSCSLEYLSITSNPYLDSDIKQHQRLQRLATGIVSVCTGLINEQRLQRLSLLTLKARQQHTGPGHVLEIPCRQNRINSSCFSSSIPQHIVSVDTHVKARNDDSCINGVRPAPQTSRYSRWSLWKI